MGDGVRLETDASQSSSLSSVGCMFAPVIPRSDHGTERLAVAGGEGDGSS